MGQHKLQNTKPGEHICKIPFTCPLGHNHRSHTTDCAVPKCLTVALRDSVITGTSVGDLLVTSNTVAILDYIATLQHTPTGGHTMTPAPSFLHIYTWPEPPTSTPMIAAIKVLLEYPLFDPSEESHTSLETRDLCAMLFQELPLGLPLHHKLDIVWYNPLIKRVHFHEETALANRSTPPP